MKRFAFLCLMLAAACEPVPSVTAPPPGTTSPGMREFMVIGGRMTFERCRALGGLIIRDVSTAMIACDPTVRGEPVPADEFAHPDV